MTEYGWDRFSVSAGLGYAGAGTAFARGFSGAVIPVVLSLTPFGRGEKSVRRMGFVIAAEGGVGIGPNSGGSADPQWFGWGGLRLGFVMR
jgi:hypothetical protein